MSAALSLSALEAVSGGTFTKNDVAPDGHEYHCAIFYHDYKYQKDNNLWCSMRSYCIETNVWKVREEDL